MDLVHDKGVHGPGPWKGVHGPGRYFEGPGPWTRSTEGVLGPGVHVLYFPLIHRQQTPYWLFTQTKLSSIYRNKPIVTYTCIGPWWNLTWSVSYNLGETQTCNNFFFSFSVARSSKACGKRRKTLKSWRGIYSSISSFFAVSWKSC